MESNQNPLNPTPLNQTHFRHLSVEEIENPFSYINKFCEQETRVYYFRQDILNLLKTAYSYQEKFYTGHSPSYGYYQQLLIRVMEAVYVLYVRGYGFSTEAGKALVDHYCCLSSDEIVDIGYFLEDFFDYKDLDEWREYLDDILLHAYKEGGVGFFEYDQTPFKTIGLLEKFAEAIFLIYELTPHERIGSTLKTPVEEALARANDERGGNHAEKSNVTGPGKFEGEDRFEKVNAADEVAGRTEGGDTSRSDVEALDGALPRRLSKEACDFFSLVDPRFIGEGLRHIIFNYMGTGFETGFGKEEMLAELMYPLQRLFELFDVARRETSHWGDMRIGSDFVK